MNVGSCLISYIEINFSYIVDLNVKSKTLKLLEDSIEE